MRISQSYYQTLGKFTRHLFTDETNKRRPHINRTALKKQHKFQSKKRLTNRKKRLFKINGEEIIDKMARVFPVKNDHPSDMMSIAEEEDQKKGGVINANHIMMEFDEVSFRAQQAKYDPQVQMTEVDYDRRCLTTNNKEELD